MAHQSHNTRPAYRLLILLLFTGSAFLLISPALAGQGVTISADGDKSYYLGEKVIMRGQNTNSDFTYLFLTGASPVPASGVNLTSPGNAVVSGNPDSFTVVKTRPDKTWEYSWYTANLPLYAGTYTLYAVSQPKATDQAGTAAASIGIIVKKPFIRAQISPASVTGGQPFTVNGTAEGDPPAVQIWIFGDHYAFTTKSAVDANASFTFNGDAALSGNLPAGEYYLFVQHSMQDNQFDIAVSGDYVRNQKLGNGTNLFKITGTGSLQGIDATDALVAAFSEPDACDDTYSVIPFQVTGTGSPASRATPDVIAPVQQTSLPVPLQYAAPIGAGALLLAGMVLWKRQ
jgi:hypothetical protein